MASRSERREQQAQMAIEHAEDQQARPNIAPAPLTDDERCPAALGRKHNYTMRGPDGIYRCWTCCRRKP